MKYVMIFVLCFFAGLSFAKERMDGKETPEKLVCVGNAELDKTMVDKGYDVLLTMTNENGVVESVWFGGQSIIITAAVPNEKQSCLIANMKNVTYNPKAVEQVWETYKKQTKQKDI